MACGAQKGGIDSIQLNFIETPHTAGGGLVAGRGCGGARAEIRAGGGQEEAFREAGRTNPPAIRDRWQPLRHGRRSIRPQRAQHPFCPRSKSSGAGSRAGPGYSWSPSSGSRSQPGPARGPSRAAGCSACRSRAVAARRGRTHPFCSFCPSSPRRPTGPSRFSCPAHPGEVIRAEGPGGTGWNRRAAGAKVTRGRPRAATGRRRAVRRRQGEASGAARGGGGAGLVVGRRGRAGGGVAARLGRGEARQQVPQRRLAGGAEWRVAQRIAGESDTGRKIASANCRSRSLMIAGELR